MTKERGTTIRKPTPTGGPVWLWCQCGYEWGTAPGSVQLNVHCPSCGMAHRELVAELEAAQPKEVT